MAMTHEALSLSRKEKDELTRSTKKVKNDCIVEMERGQGSGSSSPSHRLGGWNNQGSFRDKLLGEILGAFMQAFNLGEAMDDDEGSNDEVETLREGFSAVRFSKDFKQQIRNP